MLYGLHSRESAEVSDFPSGDADLREANETEEENRVAGGSGICKYL